MVQYVADLPPIYQNFDQVPGVEPKNIAQVGNKNILTKLSGQKKISLSFEFHTKAGFHLGNFFIQKNSTFLSQKTRTHQNFQTLHFLQNIFVFVQKDGLKNLDVFSRHFFILEHLKSFKNLNFYKNIQFET